MTASDIADDRISEFTFALLEGSGWYQPDYTKTEPFTYGKGEGCNFLDSPCLNSNTAAFSEFCDQPSELGCSLTRRGISLCPYQQLYIDSFADNCPIPLVADDGDCEDEVNQANSAIEFYGYGSKCFTGTIDLGLGGRSAFCLKPTVSIIKIKYNLLD